MTSSKIHHFVVKKKMGKQPQQLKTLFNNLAKAGYEVELNRDGEIILYDSEKRNDKNWYLISTSINYKEDEVDLRHCKNNGTGGRFERGLAHEIKIKSEKIVEILKQSKVYNKNG